MSQDSTMAFLLRNSPSLLWLFGVLSPLLFAWLVAWQERPYSPARFFLGGIVLPTLAVSTATALRALEWLGLR